MRGQHSSIPRNRGARRPRRLPLLLCALAALLLPGAVGPALAGGWSGLGSDDLWSNGANWAFWDVPGNGSGFNESTIERDKYAAFGGENTAVIDGIYSLWDLWVGHNGFDHYVHANLLGRPGCFVVTDRLQVPGNPPNYDPGEPITLTLKRGAYISCREEARIGYLVPGIITVDGAGTAPGQTCLYAPLLRLAPDGFKDNYGMRVATIQGELYVKNGGAANFGEAKVGCSWNQSGADMWRDRSLVEVTGSGSRLGFGTLRVPGIAGTPGPRDLKDEAYAGKGEVRILAGAEATQENSSGAGLVLRDNGSVTLDGGRLALYRLDRQGGTFNWVKGELRFLSDGFFIGQGGPLGASVGLSPDRLLQLHNVSVKSGGTLSVADGTLIVNRMLAREGGTFEDSRNSTVAFAQLSGFGADPVFNGYVQLGRGAGGAYDLVVSPDYGSIRSFSVGRSLSVGYDSASPFWLRVLGGTLSIGDDLVVTPNGRLWFEGGSLTARTLDVSQAKEWSPNGWHGTLTINGGTLKTKGGAFEVATSAGVDTRLRFQNGGGASFPGDLLVGKAASSRATVDQSGGTVNVAGVFRVGHGSSSSGTYNLSGDGRFNANGGYLVVGFDGVGTFNQSGGTATAEEYLYLGERGFGEGTYNLTGGTLTVGGGGLFVAGSNTQANLRTSGVRSGIVNVRGGVARVAGPLRVWPSGRAHVEGGSFETTSADIRGSVGVYEAGSQWTNTGEVRFGKPADNTGYETAAFEVAHGAALSSGSGIVGHGAGETGYAWVRDSGSRWTNSGDLTIGRSGVGTLVVQDGGAVSNKVGFLGRNAGSTGTVSVKGANSQWTNSSALYAGFDGRGDLNVYSGGRLSSNEAFIGFGGAGNGTATVQGSGSEWSIPGRLFIGYHGAGALTVMNGALLSNGGSCSLGYDGSGAVNATVTGADATWNTNGSLYLGGGANGPGKAATLAVENGGKLNVGGTLKLWGPGTLTLGASGLATVKSFEGAGGTLNLDGGTLKVEGGTFSQQGDVTITGSGSAIQLSNITGMNIGGRLTLGGDTGSVELRQEGGDRTVGGTFTLAPGGQATTCTYYLEGGSLATGTASVGLRGRGYFEHHGGTFTPNGNLYIGTERGAYGKYRLQGGALSATSVYMGNDGVADFMHTGGSVNINGNLYLGLHSGGIADWLQDTADPVAVAKTAYIGCAGRGRVLHKSGTVAFSATLRVGNDQSGVGFYQLEQTGVLRQLSDYQVIGYQGQGTLKQLGGTNEVSKYLFLAEQSTGTGTYEMASGALNVGQDLCVGGNTGAAGGKATLTVSGGEVHVTGTLRVWGGGTVTINGGKVYADIVDNTRGGAFNLNGGELHVREFRGNLVNNGGMVCPGSSPGTTTITGNYTQGPNGTLQIEIGAGTLLDVLNVAGQLSLGGRLEVLPYAGFDPRAGLSFDFLNWGSLAGQFDALSLPGLLQGLNLRWDLSSLYTQGTLNLASILDPFTVSGTVRDTDLSGLAGVTVTAKVGFIAAGTTTTNAEGNYTLSLPSGVYTLEPTKLGKTFSPATKQVSGNQNGVDFAVTGAPATYALSGTLQDSLGRSLAGVTVTAGGRSATTGTDGAYTLSGLTAGTHAVTPSKVGYTFAPATQNVTVGPDRSGVDFVGTLGTFTLSGTVKDSYGGTLAGAVVTGGGQSVTTGADGSYALTGLPATDYSVSVWLAGYAFAPATLQVTLSADQAGVDFVGTAHPFRITGRVTDDAGQPVVGATVTAGDRSVTTAVDGTYILDRLAAATYTVTPFLNEHVFTPASLSVTVGPDASGADFTAAANTYSVAGAVTLGAAPMPGVTVTAGGRTATTGADGTYAISGLAAGVYEVTASLAEHTFAPSSTRAALGADSGQASVDFSATLSTYAIRGMITDGSSQPLAGVTVAAGGQTAMTGADGAYAISGLAAGTYTVEPALAEFRFDPPRAEVTVGPDRVADFAGRMNAYTIGGTVLDSRDQPLAGVALKGLPGDPETDAAGRYLATVDARWGGVVTPQKSGVAFEPETRIYAAVAADAEDNYTGRDVDPPAFTTSPQAVTLEQAGPDGAAANLDALAATDNTDPNPVVTNDAPEVFPPGETMVTWTATDAAGNAATAIQKVTVRDTTPPTITPPADVRVDHDGAGSPPVDLGQPTITDACDADPAVTNDAPEAFPLGETTVTWTVTDAAGNVATATQTVTVRDTRAPALVNVTAAPSSLWPLDGGMQEATVSADLDDDTARYCITAVSYEGHTVYAGSDDLDPNVEFTGEHTVKLRAEYAGDGSDRVYTITVQAVDSSGNLTSAECTVTAAPWRFARNSGLSLFGLAVQTDPIAPAALGLQGVPIAAWDAVAQRYLLNAELPQLRNGVGYWLRLADPRPARCTGPGATEPQAITLKRGWNLVAVPFLQAVPWSIQGIKVRRGGEERTLAEAHTAGWVQDYALRWVPNPANPDTGSYGLVYDASVIPGVAGQLDPWRGYWVRAAGECEMLIPVPGAPSRAAARGRAPGAAGWSVRLAARGRRAAGEVVVGITGSSRAMAIGTPPQPPNAGTTTRVSLVGSDGPLAADLRAGMDARQSWDLVVETGRIGDAAGEDEEITLSWPDLRALPRDVALTLVDTATGARRYLRTTGGYRFHAGEGTRRFRLEAEQRLQAPVMVTGLEVQQTRSGARTVRFSLSAAAVVDVDVVTPTGRTLASPIRGRASDPGLNQVPWAGTMPPGIHLVRVTATTDAGVSFQAIRPVLITR